MQTQHDRQTGHVLFSFTATSPLVGGGEVEGVTSFAATFSEKYRYIISLKEGQMSLWFEGLRTKKQWHTGWLGMSDWVTADNAISGASVDNYVQCFQEALDCPIDAPSDAQRKLVAVDDGKMRLEIVVKIRVLRSAWSAKYTFDLEPISVERIDVLESKLRDQQDELERIRRELESDRAPIAFQSAAASKDSQNRLSWNAVVAKDFRVTNECSIQFLRAGTYQIGVVVNNQPTAHNIEVALLKNGTIIQKAYCCFANGHCSSTSLSCATQVEKNDKLVVTCGCNLSGTSYLTLVRLGG